MVVPQQNDELQHRHNPAPKGSFSIACKPAKRETGIKQNLKKTLKISQLGKMNKTAEGINVYCCLIKAIKSFS